MKAIVTGGAGFIGSHIQDRLVTDGLQVTVIDNLRSGKKENLNPKAKFFKVDIRDKTGLERVFKQFRPEVIFHLAAQNEVPYSMTHPEEDEEINIRGMMNLLDLSVNFKVKKFVYSNTGGAFYGDVPMSALPTSEDQVVLRPASYYGVSKSCAELYLKMYGNVFKLPWVSLRYANVYGPRQVGNREAGIVAIFTTKMLAGEQPVMNGDGRHTRDYIYVGDVVEANIKAAKYPKNDYFNISTGRRISNQTVYDLIEGHLKTGIKLTYGPERPGDPLHNCLSPIKAKKLLKWQAKLRFEDGVKRTLDYYLKQNP